MCKSSSDIPSEEAISYKLEDAASTVSGGFHEDSKEPGACDRKGSVLAGYSVLTKSMLGSGLFFIAHACSKFGIISGLVALGFAGLLTWISLKALAILAIEFKHEQPTFYSISTKIMPNLRWLIDSAVIMNCLGAASGYVITSGNLLSEGLLQMAYNKVEGPTKARTMMIVQGSMILVLAPLCMMRELSGTKIANIIGLLSLLYIVISSFVYCDLSMASADLLGMDNILSAMSSFPTFIFAFACQMNVFQIASELKNPTVKRMNLISIASTVTGAAIYVPIMIIPLLSFGKGIKENYLQSLDLTEVPVQIAYMLAALSVSISYVLQIHPLRRSILSLYYRGRVPSAAEERRNRLLVVGFVMMVTFGIAVGVKKIDVVTNFTGLFGANTLCFVAPSWLYIRHNGVRGSPFNKLVLALFIFGLILYPLCLTGIIYDLVN